MTQTEMDEDKVEMRIEKTFFRMVNITTFIAVIPLIWLCLSIVQFFKNENSQVGVYLLINLIIAIIIFLISVFIQWYAFKLHNQKYMDKKLNAFSTEPNLDYAQQIDEGEKFELYRISFLALNKINMGVFPTVFGILIVQGLATSFNPDYFLLIGGIWIVMNIIVYIEGYKANKKEFTENDRNTKIK
ncbi:MAG: DUF3169 family protein [Bacillaceae bacterium]|nr:DUF3169 family protein [Bacillaceae bacterium]